jgi:hypothetical protein
MVAHDLMIGAIGPYRCGAPVKAGCRAVASVIAFRNSNLGPEVLQNKY